MPQTKRPAWVKALIKGLNNNLYGISLVACMILFVFCLYNFCFDLSTKNVKTPAVIASQPVYNQFYCCSCCKASGISPFLIKLPRFMATTQTPAHRLVIYASDIRQLTGCSKSSSQRQLAKIKTKLGKEAHQYLMIEEYCSEVGLNYEKTLVQLKLK